MSEICSLHGTCPPIPDNLTTVQFLLDAYHPTRPVRRDPLPWLIEDATGRGVGFEEVRARTFGLANALSARWKINESDIVCLFGVNHLDYPIAIWAVHRLGAIVSPANPSYSSEELTHQLKISGSTLLITQPSSLPVARAAARVAGISEDRILLFGPLAQPSAFLYPILDDLIADGLASEPTFIERALNPGEGKTKLAFLSFSSGTTGKPKAVAIPHYSVLSNVIQMAAMQKVNEDYTTWDKRRFRPGDVSVAVLPWFHIYGLVVNLHFMLFAGLSIVVVPKFNFVKFLESIDRFKITHLLIVPPQVVLLCKHPETKRYDLSHVRFAFCGAAPLSAELSQQLTKVLPNASIGQGYGMTETCTTLAMVPISQHIGTPGSAGQLLPGVVARVVKEDGSLADFGEEGELHVSGPQLALRYMNNPEATAETFVNGWVITGDKVVINKAGDMFIVDRVKEIMKVRGFQVAPAELEGHLLDHPDVTDACVVGVPDDYSGEVPLAFVSLDVKAAERIETNPQESKKIKASIFKHVSDAKVKYKWLEGGIEFVNVIPKNPSGKLLRRVMRDQARVLKTKQRTDGGVTSKL